MWDSFFKQRKYMTLKEKLIKENKNKWLDVGCNKNFEQGFYYLDTWPIEKIPLKYRKKYFELDILRATDKKIKLLGKFDLIRMQHVLEHFPYEEGLIVIGKIAKILKNEGIFIVTVPDLKIHTEKYINRKYKKWGDYSWWIKKWATKRIPADAPDSFYFSVFAYSLPVTPHKWCYDYNGLEYLLKSSKLFRKIKKIDFRNPLASFPFTHNRPEEDVCVMAIKK